MSKRDEFNALMKINKKATPNPNNSDGKKDSSQETRPVIEFPSGEPRWLLWLSKLLDIATYVLLMPSFFFMFISALIIESPLKGLAGLIWKRLALISLLFLIIWGVLWMVENACRKKWEKR